MRDEVEAELTGPGGPFEVVTEEVDGVPMRMYRDRLPHLRAIAEIAARRGDEREFLVQGDRRVSYGEVFERANAMSATLGERYGVGRGDRVAVLSANNIEWCLTFWATVDLGAVLVGLNGWWKADEILYGLRDSGATVLVADRRRLERVADRLDECPDLEAVFVIEPDAPTEPDATPPVLPFFELEAHGRAGFPEVPIAEGDPAVIFYTSGTTGRPKGAISTHRSMIANLQNTMYKAAVNARLTPRERPGQTVSLLTSPLFHVAGCHSSMVVGTLAGVRLVMLEGRFDPEEVLGVIERERVTIWATVPTMVWRVCQHPARHDHDTASVTTVAFGGSPAADELQRLIHETFPNVASTTNSYGLTESSSSATMITGDDARRKPASVGPPLPVVELRVVDPEGRDLPTGRTGEVLIRGPILMAGYWCKPEATAETIVDGWLHTGDIGFLDEEGFLTITDRAKDMIIRGGENVYCVEIEQRLVEHPEIVDAAVVGVPHPELGEQVKAVVQVGGGSTLTDEDVRGWVADALADFKVPEIVTITDEDLPRNASGKLLKNVLRGEGEVSFAETM